MAATIMMTIDKAMITEVKYVPATDRYQSKVQFVISTAETKMFVSLPNATQEEYNNILALASSFEPVRIVTGLHVRSYNNNQFLELRAPDIRRIIPQTQRSAEPAR